MIRFAIWTAVSTEAQATGEKDSLDEQLKRCRAIGLAKGWQEVGQPYIVPGESRTRWVNLRDAENEITPLHQMLEDAKSRLFDVLILYDYNRLRDLLDPVAKTLASYGAQIYSVNQAVEPLPPETFSPYASDSESMMRGMSQVISRWQINDLRRKHTFGVMGRIRKGLHPSGKAPYGYNIKDGLLILDPAQAAVLLQIKELYLSGLGVPQIIAHLHSRHIPPPHGKAWSDYGIRYMLKNPIYCGTVRLGCFRKINDPRTGRSRQVIGDPAKILSGSGQHQTLWDDSAHKSILAEMKRRGKRNKGMKTQRLSNLLYCAEHDRPLRVIYLSGKRDDSHRAWYCVSQPGHWHLTIRDDQTLTSIADRLVLDLKSISAQMELPIQQDDSDLLRSALDDLLARRERLTDALEAGGLDPATYSVRIQSLDERLTAIQSSLSAAENRSANHKARLDALSAIVAVIEKTPQFITQAAPQLVNTQLRALIEKVAISSDSDFKILYR